MQGSIQTKDSHLLFARHNSTRQLSRRPFTSQPCKRGQLQVVAVKGQGKKRAQQQMGAAQQGPPTPDVDLENVEFVIFIRATKLPQWYPLSIVKAGAAANSLVRGLESEWGKRLYGKTLIRNIAQSVYRDRKNIEKSFKSQMAPMKNMTEFEYGFKIRDKTDPKSWYKSDNLTPLPAENKLGQSFLEKIRDKIKGQGK